MPVLLKHGAKHIATSASQRSFPRADSNLSRQSSRPTVVSAGSRLTSAGSNLLNEVRRRSRHATFSQRIRNPKECLKALKQFTRKYHLKYLVPLFVVMIYMFVGALLFLWLESAAEEKRINNRIREYDREVELLVKRIEEIATDQAAQRAPVRRRFVREALDWFHKQVDLKPQLEPEWSLTSAMYFSGTIFTTIGFGDIACETAVGRILTVLYAVVGWLNGKRLSSMLTLGIPIMLITLNDLGKFCYKSINDFIFACGRRWFWLRSCFRREPPSKDHLLEMETGNGGLNVEESTHRVSFNLRPASEELTLNLETYGDNDEPPTMRTLSVEDPTGHSIEPIPVLRQRSETAENSIDMLSGGDFNAEDELLIPSGPPPRMSVLTALSVTLIWIFSCAGLFCLWEDWSYTTSVYFMFISMSTIGLGDVNVKRRDFMVLCFLIVIIGLSLVSMTIAVIQQSLEELYKKLLMKLLLEYQAKLASGDHKGASMGLMKSFGSSKAAKYLLPMISADTRRNVMVQIQEEAKETGIELPPIFEDLDAKTGMPKILVFSEDKNHQTLGIQTDELAVQTDYATSVEETQTYNAEMRENETMTTVSSYESNEVQTEMVTTMEQELQTYVVDLIENESQTEIVETKNERIQTPYPETFAVEVQTEDGDMGEPFKGPSRITQARRRIQKAFKSRSTKTPDSTEEKPEMSEWKDVSDGDNLSHSSKESLDWDPVDGLHAEKQRPVKDLKRFFDKSRAKKK
ncbi:Potassium channel subfamily K member 18 [Aphelenchoides besseyi]|nr:Potassium channel subfamily K member 18 [Aphelenchoides besseyi]